MIKHSYNITVRGRTLKDFEFIVGPMIMLSIPQPPRQPEEFIFAAFNGGATPIAAPREIEGDTYLADMRIIRRKMEDRYFGANIFAVWKIAYKIIKGFNKLGADSPDFLDINGIELYFPELLLLLKDVTVPIYLGITQPISIYTFKKFLLQKEYSFLLNRIESGTLKLYLPNNRGGGHLPVLMKKQEKINWIDALIKEVMDIEKAIKMPIPFIIEKGLMTVDDFVNTIVKYSQYPSFSGIRFASILEMTKESGLNQASKMLLTKIVTENKKEMIIPIHSCVAASKYKNGMKVRGGLIIYVVATKIARMIHEIQCNGKDFPQYSRLYNPMVLVNQAITTSRRVCHLCNDSCPMEFCEIKGSWDSTSLDGSIDDALIFISPRIFEIDPRYINASATFVVQDLIQQTLSRI